MITPGGGALRIKVLPKDLADKIAAGEIIERPASIVKELFENALDAGADEITVELGGGGKESIRVTDNGCGMDTAEAEVAFERHATSKLASLDDLYNVRSFGFRGEALPSIAAVATLEMTTRTRDSIAGTRIVLEQGRLREIIHTGCPAGTSVLARDIFAAIPVRKKFLKKDSAEQGHCVDVVARIALAHPQIRVRVLANEKIILNIPRTDDLLERLALVLGREFRDNAIAFEKTIGEARVFGFISRPELTRSNTRNILYYVNRRFVRDTTIHYALMSAYRRLIESGRYPSAAIFLEMPPSEVDVNVHPSKTEIRFQTPGAVYDILFEAFTEALSYILPSPQPGQLRGETPAQAQFLKGVERSLQSYKLLAGLGKPSFADIKAALPPAVSHRAQADALQAPRTGFFSSLDYLGQISGTYLVFAGGEGIVIIDQHAAHERVVFETLRRRVREQTVMIQTLLIPETVEIASRESLADAEAEKILKETGFEIEPVDKSSVMIKAVPIELAGADLKSLLLDIISALSEAGQAREMDAVRDSVLALVACKSAVKANRILDAAEVRRLCRDLDSVPFASNCPHGRPAYIELHVREIEKWFKR